MKSIWKDLLFLHGHLLHKDELAWRPDARTDANRDGAAAKKARSTAVKCCAAVVWPRLSAPR